MDQLSAHKGSTSIVNACVSAISRRVGRGSSRAAKYCNSFRQSSSDIAGLYINGWFPDNTKQWCRALQRSLGYVHRVKRGVLMQVRESYTHERNNNRVISTFFGPVSSAVLNTFHAADRGILTFSTGITAAVVSKRADLGANNVNCSVCKG
ncbi:hypothetical protein BC832DRAFT_611271 [Gaertneriomyces semiglobifer]|nr:hypothetical protein BC832DRAFT_611271 [Gaertneriomyces semiglobifer]